MEKVNYLTNEEIKDVLRRIGIRQKPELDIAIAEYKEYWQAVYLASPEGSNAVVMNSLVKGGVKMKKVFLSFIGIVCSSLIILCGLFGRAEATTITFDLNYEFSGATSPSGTSPWLSATFTDVSGGVELTLTSLLNSPTEFVGQKGWYFNFDPTLSPTLLSFSYQSGTEAASINTVVNNFKADGDGYYDIQFTWNVLDFGMGDSVKYSITSTESISALSFNFISIPSGGAGTYLSAAHIQGINGGNGGSGWIAPVPEPGIFLLLGIGLLGLAIYAKIRRK